MASNNSSPLANRFFLLFVGATFISNVGTWLFVVGSGWLMTELNGSALMVSLVQTAAMLPMVLFALPAGTLGDLFDRRKIIIICQSAMIANTLLFAYLIYLDQVTVPLLLVFTLINGVGAAFARPVMSAIIPLLVSRDNLRTAMAMSSISFNLSRAIGPVLGGLLISQLAIDWPFWVDGLSFAAVVVVMLLWNNKDAPEETVSARDFKLAIGESVRFLRYTPALYNSILRAGVFFVSAGALWALMPLVAKDRLSGSADLYGYLVGIAGLGAVVAGFMGNWLTRQLNSSKLTGLASILLSAGLALLGYTQHIGVALSASFLCGMCWQLSFTNLITSAQYALPKWYGARGMSYFIMAMSASLALGSAFWGFLADNSSIEMAYYCAAGLGILLLPLSFRFPLDQAKEADLRAVDDYSIPQFLADNDERHVVLVIHHYHLGNASLLKATKQLKKLRNKRYRAGAVEWGLFIHAEQDNCLVETYRELSASQVERHARQITREDNERVTEILDWIQEQGGRIETRYYKEA